MFLQVFVPSGQDIHCLLYCSAFASLAILWPNFSAVLFNVDAEDPPASVVAVAIRSIFAEPKCAKLGNAVPLAVRIVFEMGTCLKTTTVVCTRKTRTSLGINYLSIASPKGYHMAGGHKQGPYRNVFTFFSFMPIFLQRGEESDNSFKYVLHAKLPNIKLQSAMQEVKSQFSRLRMIPQIAKAKIFLPSHLSYTYGSVHCAGTLYHM